MTSQDQISTFTGRHPHGNVLLEYHTVTDNTTMIAHIHVILSSFTFLGQDNMLDCWEELSISLCIPRQWPE